MNKYSQLSISLTKKITKTEKKENGIYFTPSTIIITILKILEGYNFVEILEPACGSCEFIKHLDNSLDNCVIDGIELNKTIYNEIKDIQSKKNSIRIIQDDFLKFKTNNQYDLVIGNPPFYVIKKEKCPNEYLKYIVGRPNIFILFIIKAFELLKENGILAFVLPMNFLNCVYYQKIRREIYDNFKIINILTFNEAKFIETQQQTCAIIIQKSKYNWFNHNFTLEKFTTFNTPTTIKELRILLDFSTSLSQMNFKVKVGNVVWNQVKDKLTDDNTFSRLIYSSEIKDNKLVIKKFKNPEKKNYITQDGYNKPLLVVNRGYGMGQYCFNYCLIDIPNKYRIENHLICIIPKKDISKDELIKAYNKIIKSFEDPRTKKFVDIYFANNAINTSELQYVLPIYLYPKT
jgi:type I restriction-modification system DNA methylase subunit